MIRESIRTFASGFLMGSADVVPGVSGGTIALVLGIYERLISSVRAGSSALGSLIKGDFTGMRRNLGEVEWLFLTTLLVGILTAVLTLAQLIHNLLEEEPIVLSAAFFGLVVGSVLVAYGMIRIKSSRLIGVIAAVGLALFWVLGFGTAVVATDLSLAAYFGSGALAICAMILPGISGSLILVLIGTYDAVLGAVNDRDYAAVAVFLLGAIVGLALFSQILYRALRQAHDLVLAVLIGLMAGSLRILWPWPDGVEGPELAPPDTQLVMAVVAAILGFAFVVAISRVSARVEQQVSDPALS
jgi:putative membrane protein